MSTIINRLEELGEIKVNRISDLTSLHPITSDRKSIEDFQQCVDEIKKSDGLGYEIVKTHTTSEVGINWVDLILIRFTSK